MTADTNAAGVWQQLTAGEREALQYLGGYCDWEFIQEGTFESLTEKHLAVVANDDDWYGPSYAITDWGREVVKEHLQATASPATGDGAGGDLGGLEVPDGKGWVKLKTWKEMYESCAEALREQYKLTEFWMDKLEAQQADHARLRDHVDGLRVVMEAAAAAEMLRAKAKEMSSNADKLYDSLQDSDNPMDRRTKAWKDHDEASRASNMAWHDFNNALRNIGLDICTLYRKQALASNATASADSGGA